MPTLDTPETLAALHRLNACARMRRLAVNAMVYESRNASSLAALREAIERHAAELDAAELNLSRGS